MNSRRDFLRHTTLGAGALAFNDVFAAGTTSPPTRFVFIRKSNGLRPKEVALPTFSEQEKKLDSDKKTLELDLDKHELPEWMQAVAPHKANMTILQGLSAKMSENGHSSWSSVMGCYKSGRNSLSGIKRATIDFELAKLFPSPFGHVELALRGSYSSFATGIIAGYSAPSPHQRNYCYADPNTAYNELFKCVLAPEVVNSDNSMLAFLQGEESFKAKVLAGYEKLKLSNHVESIESIRARNKKLERMSGAITRHLPKLAPVHLNGGQNATTPEKQAAMTDILVAALVTGLTNVVTYTIDELSTPINGLPGNEGDRISIHELGHNGGYSGVPAEQIREKIRVGHMQQVNTIIERLKATPEGTGSMFDNTVVMYFPENAETHHSHGWEAPFLVFSGNKVNLDMAGRYIRLPYHGAEGHKPLGCWYTTLLNAHGNLIEHYGDLDLDMSRKKLAQSGSIPQLMV
ncbi:MAG: hypothetical protein ACI8W8_002985 [Rhodothermales bacterium]|jgi:hypothetical protein